MRRFLLLFVLWVLILTGGLLSYAMNNTSGLESFILKDGSLEISLMDSSAGKIFINNPENMVFVIRKNPKVEAKKLRLELECSDGSREIYNLNFARGNEIVQQVSFMDCKDHVTLKMSFSYDDTVEYYESILFYKTAKTNKAINTSKIVFNFNMKNEVFNDKVVYVKVGEKMKLPKLENGVFYFEDGSVKIPDSVLKNKSFNGWLAKSDGLIYKHNYPVEKETELVAVWKNNPASSKEVTPVSNNKSEVIESTPVPKASISTEEEKVEEKIFIEDSNIPLSEYPEDFIAKFKIGSKEYLMRDIFTVDKKTMDSPPVVQQNRVLLPVRLTGELLGIQVKYDKNTKTSKFIYFDGKHKENVIEMKLGEKMMNVNKKKVPLTADVALIDGRIMLPVSDLQKALKSLGLTVKLDWNHKTKTVTVLG